MKKIFIALAIVCLAPTAKAIKCEIAAGPKGKVLNQVKTVDVGEIEDAEKKKAKIIDREVVEGISVTAFVDSKLTKVFMQDLDSGIVTHGEFTGSGGVLSMSNAKSTVSVLCLEDSGK